MTEQDASGAVEIDLDGLLAYRSAEGHPNDAATRSAYVAYLLEHGQADR